MRNIFLALVFTTLLLLAGCYYLWGIKTLWLLLILLPLYVLGFIDFFQTENVIRRNYPILGRFRYLMEDLRPKVHQYFVETDLNGRPFNRLTREIVYHRAHGTLGTNPFGTQLNTYEEGYEWMLHSIGSLHPNQLNHHPRVRIGGPDCTQPYDASLLNISAMSYGSLSKNAVMALNGAAAIGNFAHNTGEGGISAYHLANGGDLIFQFGTGYFGCRTPDGHFSEKEFAKRAALKKVKMIEVKLSQGAKPGHGGILPAKKNNEEISEIRGVPKGIDVISPPYHSAFSNPLEFMHFIGRLRTLANGKPIGFKLCVGHKREFLSLCKAMVETGILPDFISIDGAEGGTGAAPLEFSNAVGTPLKEGLATVVDCLRGFGIRDKIKVIAAGKIATAFDMFRVLAIGADCCYSARAMMFALGCIQALECNSNTCPTGITSHNPSLTAGLVPQSKAVHVARFHKDTLHHLVELLAAAGVNHPSKLNRSMIHRRLNVYESRSFEQIMPSMPIGQLLQLNDIPPSWQQDMYQSSSRHFTPSGILED